LQPDRAETHFALGNALVMRGRFDEAQPHFAEALRLKPDHVGAHCNLANLLVLRGRLNEALSHYREALRINPEYAEGHYYLAGALARQKKIAEAVAHFEAALRLQPGYAIAANDLAWILATETNAAIRNVDEAIRLAMRACDWTTNQEAMYLDTLGVAYSEAGRFAEAVQATERGAASALAAGDRKLAAQIQSRLEHYRASRAYHAISEGSGR